MNEKPNQIDSDTQPSIHNESLSEGSQPTRIEVDSLVSENRKKRNAEEVKENIGEILLNAYKGKLQNARTKQLQSQAVQRIALKLQDQKYSEDFLEKWAHGSQQARVRDYEDRIALALQDEDLEELDKIFLDIIQADAVQA